ncbi:MAG: hypothetical protein Q8O84_02635 [Nanoarchaeota archaeon]|nr:hypothetical protein [Nanoarchaeota archaeon]MDP3758596.1 hypothetical protein [Candidatus Daviesbacteria bacterium]
MTEKKNEIFIDKSQRKYFLSYQDNNYKHKNKIVSYFRTVFSEGDFYKLIKEILKMSSDFYKKGIDLKIKEDSVVEISKNEKQTIEKLVKRLEKNAKENKNLKYTIKVINDLSK